MTAGAMVICAPPHVGGGGGDKGGGDESRNLYKIEENERRRRLELSNGRIGPKFDGLPIYESILAHARATG